MKIEISCFPGRIKHPGGMTETIFSHCPQVFFFVRKVPFKGIKKRLNSSWRSSTSKKSLSDFWKKLKIGLDRENRDLCVGLSFCANDINGSSLCFFLKNPVKDQFGKFSYMKRFSGIAKVDFTAAMMRSSPGFSTLFLSFDTNCADHSDRFYKSIQRV